ncbi:DUF2971 domain-containing protein [Pseudoalteromonas sp. T1lg24]|uniref:DUF2971 domain-containing protein n=1 Tax=Pseudoalteromonas sp. T1lg24 TaxID=2077099 RepID=UPI000CF62BD1|nr:DUF2971 domain-containing protein [Pseudoalteromonas sp. T1lg24]
MNKNKDGLIYHYTSIQGFLGIIETQSLWVTSINGVNDSLEGKLHDSLLKSALANLSLSPLDVIEFMEKYQKSNPITPHLRKIPDMEGNPEFIDTLRDLCKGTMGELISSSLNFISAALLPHICCFSNQRDKLSQWRAYGDDGKGVVLAFDRAEIESSIKKDLGFPVEVRDVIYDKAEQESYSKELVQRLIRHMMIKQTNSSLESVKVSKDYFISPLLFKNYTFSEEEEVRLIYNSSDAKDSKFRCVNGNIVSYYEHAFHAQSLKGIVLGPKCSLLTHTNDFKAFLSRNFKHVLDDGFIEKSASSYR